MIEGLFNKKTPHKAYEDRLFHEVFERNTFKEFLFGKVINKEDIIRIDAALENEQRDKIAVEKKRLAGMDSQDRTELDKMEKKLERMQGSNLFIGDQKETHYFDEESGKFIDKKGREMRGDIDGKLFFLYEMSNGKPRNTNDEPIEWIRRTAEGTVDGVGIPESVVIEIFDNYAEIAEERTEKIREIIAQRRKKDKDADDKSWDF